MQSLRGIARRAFTLIELMVVIVILGLLMALVLPAVSSTRANARRLTCASHLREWGHATYNLKTTGRSVDPDNWVDTLLVYAQDQSSLQNCPEQPEAESYGMNNLGHRLTESEGGKVYLLDLRGRITKSGEIPIVAVDNPTPDSCEAWDKQKAMRHFGVANVLYVDGHVRPERESSIDPCSRQIHKLRWLPRVGDDPYESVREYGLAANYFTGWWDGESAERIDTTLHCPFGAAFFGFTEWNIPLPGSNSSGWDTGSFGSATWTGSIRPPEGVTSAITFHLACDNEAWFYVDGNEVIHRPTGGVRGVTTYQVSDPVTLSTGDWTKIRVRLREYTPGRSPSHVSIKWSYDGGEPTVIPTENLRPF